MPGTGIAFSDIVGRRIRLGSWQDQKVSTYRRIQEAVAHGRWDEAAALAHYFVDEADVCFTLYRQWDADLQGFLRDEGVAAFQKSFDHVLGTLAAKHRALADS